MHHLIPVSKHIGSWIFTILLWIGVNVLVISHYQSILPPGQDLMITMFLFNAGLLMIFLAYKYYGEIINPYTFMGLFIIQWGISFIRFSSRQHEYSLLSNAIAVASISCFCIGMLAVGKRTYRSELILNDKMKVLVFHLFFWGGVVVFLLEIMRVGYFPFLVILKGRNSNVYGEMNRSLIPLAHYLVLFHALLPVMAFLLYKRMLISKFMLRIFIAVSVFMLLNYLGRQFFLIIVISGLAYYNYHHKLSIIRLVVIGIGLAALFMIFGNMRSHTETLEEANTFLRFYSDIPYEISLFDTYMTLYSSLNFSTFNTMMNSAFDQMYLGYGIYTFKPMISLLFVDRVGLVNYPEAYDSFMSLGTYMAEPFLDFGWIGVIVINLFYGAFCAMVFNAYYYKNGTLAIVNWTVVAFCLFMLTFANYFNNFLIWFFVIAVNMFAEKK